MYSQEDTIVKHLKGYKWIWPKGKLIINQREELSQKHFDDTLYKLPSFVEFLSNDSIILYGISLINYDNIQLSFSHDNGRVSAMEDSIGKCPNFILIQVSNSQKIKGAESNNKHTTGSENFTTNDDSDNYYFQLNSNLDLGVSIDENNKEIYEATYRIISETDFRYNSKIGGFEINQSGKKNKSFILSFLGEKKIALIPVN